jgi:Family of unknown function (DUF6178)
MNPDRPAQPEAQPSDKDGDNVIALSKYRARLGRGKRLRRIDSVMASPNPEQTIQALPGDELYYLLREDDPREAKELLAYAKSEQVQVVLDFGLWSGDQLLPERMEEWVDVMAEMPFETIGDWIRGFDVELVALLIRKGARIYDLEIEDPPDEPAGMFYSTPDRFFVLDVVGYQPAGHPDAEGLGDDPTDDPSEIEAPTSARSLIRIIDALYRADLNLARRILVGAKSELDSGLEEMALRWRQGRMADLGFIDALEALEIYRELDPATVRIGELRPGTRMRPVGMDEREAPPDLLRAPGVLGEHLGGSSLFARALSRVTSNSELQELHFTLVALTNRILSADRVDAADDRTVAATLTRMRATLDLAVEFLARGGAGGGPIDDDRAVDAVRTVAVIRLFRLGVSLIGKVRALAQALDRRGPFAALGNLDLVEEPEATVMAAINRARPLYSSLLDDPPAAGERAFGSLADIARAAAAIERAAVAQAMLVGLGVRPEHLVPDALEGVEPADPVEIDTAVLARTALALILVSDERFVADRPTELQRRSHAVGKPPAPSPIPRPSSWPIFRPLTPTEAASLGGSQAPGRPGAGRSKRSGAPPAAKTRALRDELETTARSILEQVSPPGRQSSAREMSDRWIEGLSPLAPVLVRPAPPPERKRR